jgi:hypothetical protein
MPNGYGDPRVVRLDHNATVGPQLVVGCVVTAVALVVTFCALVGLVAVLGGAVDGNVGGLAVGLVFIGLGVGIVVAMVKWLRRGRTWVDGTVLVVKGPYGPERRCDLSTAVVEIDSVTEHKTVSTYNPGTQTYTSSSVPVGRIPRLVIRDQGSGKVIRLPLRKPRGGFLPADQLRALADAIAAGRRPEPHAEQADRIAAGLRQLADNPFSGHL